MPLALLLLACAQAAPPPTVVVPPQPPQPPAVPVKPVAEPPPPAPPPPKPFDFAAAKRIAISALPLHAAAPRPIGDKNAPLRLHEVARAADKTPLLRAEAKDQPYDPARYNETKMRKHLPPGAPGGIPLEHEGHALHSIYESGGKILLDYRPATLAILSGTTVETVVDLEPASLPLTEEDRSFDDIDQAQYRDGIVYLCRGYNAWLRPRKGYVTAFDAATGELRWRSPPQTCGGIVNVIGDYLLTGYGEDVMPYQLKLLRRYDGAVVQSIRNDGAALDILVESDTKLVVETYKHRITYELR